MTYQHPPRPDQHQPYGPQRYPPQPYPAPHYPNAGPPSKALAITALVLAILGFFVITAIVAVILAIISLVQSRGGRPNGKGMAISALVICTLWVIGGIVAIVAVVNSQAERDSSGQVVEEGRVLVTSIRVGDCLVDEPGGSAQLTVKLTPCSKPHRMEAYANFELPGGAFPGQAKVDRLAEGGCTSRFEAYVGSGYDDSELDVVFLRPYKESWAGDKGVTCMVGAGEATTGSLKGANR